MKPTHSKLNIVILDDSPLDAKMLEILLGNSELVNIVKVFSDPQKFLKEAPGLNMDLCLLDIYMPGIDGLLVAQILEGKPLVFVTASEEKLKDALALNPIDVVSKPIVKERLDHAIEKAYELIHIKRTHATFNVAECKRKVTIHLSDIMFVTTDEIDPRHKRITLRNGTSYTLMNCSLERLLELSPGLIQANRAELISLDSIHETSHDLVVLKDVYTENGKPLEITIGNKFRENFQKIAFFN